MSQTPNTVPAHTPSQHQHPDMMMVTLILSESARPALVRLSPTGPGEVSISFHDQDFNTLATVYLPLTACRSLTESLVYLLDGAPYHADAAATILDLAHSMTDTRNVDGESWSPVAGPAHQDEVELEMDDEHQEGTLCKCSRCY